MKNYWVTFLSGKVLVKARGAGIERLLNNLTRSGLMMWKIKRLRTNEFIFYIALPDVHKLREAARHRDCKIYFLRGEGLPFLWKRILKNSGFAVGVLLFFFVILFLSNVTWGIQIEGADPETEHKIRKELNEMGVKIGTLHFFNDDPEWIQQRLMESIENLTWIGVELKGTTFQFQAVQKTEPEKIEAQSPGHLVAKKKAVIADLFVEKGKPVVKIHQLVEKGQLLVSGIIGREENEEFIPAKGVVWGMTWYTTTVEFPLDSSFHVYSGEEKRVHSLQLGKVTIPLWGLKKNDYQDYVTENEEHPLHFLGWKIPIIYQELTIREKEDIQRSLTVKEAVKAAKELARRDLKQNIPEDAKLDSEYILHQQVENGKVKLSINFQVLENIAMEKPIIQGDNTE